MTRKIVIVLFIATAILLTTTAIARPAPSPKNKSLVWRITGNGLKKPSYLFGMIDFICVEDFLWTSYAEDCFSKCEKVCFSLNHGDPTLQKEMSQLFVDQHKKFSDYFTAREYDAVKRFVKDSMHVDLDQQRLQSLKPIAIQPSLIKQLLGCAEPVTYESRILEHAERNGLGVKSIETASDIVDEIAATHFNDKVAGVLVEMASGSTYYRTFRKNIEQAYQEQDIQKIHELFLGNKMLSGADQKILLDEKNKRWVSRMPELMQQSAVFFAANCVNMWGDNGLIDLLRKAGYTVDPVY